MKQNILGQDPYTFQKKQRSRIGVCIFLLCSALLCNLLLTVFRTDVNHTVMLLLNILVDILCGIFLLHRIHTVLLPLHRRYRLLLRDKTAVTGVIDSIGSEPVRYMDLDCYTVEVEGRRFFLPDSPLTLTVGQTYTLYTVSNVIVEVSL